MLKKDTTDFVYYRRDISSDHYADAIGYMLPYEKVRELLVASRKNPASAFKKMHKGEIVKTKFATYWSERK